MKKKSVKITIACILFLLVVLFGVHHTVSKQNNFVEYNASDDIKNSFSKEIVRLDIEKHIGYDKQMVYTKCDELINEFALMLSTLKPSDISYEAIYGEATYVITIQYNDGTREKLNAFGKSEFLLRNNILYDIDVNDIESIWKAIA